MKKLLFAILVVLVAFQAQASAGIISGTVALVDAENGKLTVSSENLEAETETTSEIFVQADTVYNGILALAELKAGDEVTVETADVPEGGALSAVSVTKEPSLEALTEELEAETEESVKEELAELPA